jgi:hypothetical protein
MWPPWKASELGHDARIGGEDAGVVHHLGEADDLPVPAELQEVGDLQRRAAGLVRRGGDAGREVDAQIHDHALGVFEEVADAVGAQHVGDLVRIADRGGDALGQHAAVELERGDERGFDVEVGVDEAGHGKAAVAFDQPHAVVIAIGADDAVADDGDVGVGDGAGDDVEQPDILDDDVGGISPAPALIMRLSGSEAGMAAV